MNLNHLITANQNNFQTICVRLANGAEGQIYTYKAPIAMVLVPGDTVIVAKNGTAKTGQPQYRTVLVVEVHEFPQIDYASDINYAWIVDKVDDVGYLEQIEIEHNQAEQLARVEVQAKKREYVQMVQENNPELLEFFQQPKQAPKNTQVETDSPEVKE